MEIPQIGLGTWQNTDSETCKNSVKNALDIGYRHIDTAQIYGNEESVGQGISASKVDRSEIFLASKVWVDKLDSEGVVRSTEESLRKLGVDYVDLMYVHWPSGNYRVGDTFEGFQELLDRGLIDRVGVSNFDVGLLREAEKHIEVYANQVEMHPLLPQKELMQYCAANNIELVAYSPLARGDVLETPELNEVADQYGVSPAQVSLAWLMDKGAKPIPKSASEKHIRENFEALNIELQPHDIEIIDSINRRNRVVDSEMGPWS